MVIFVIYKLYLVILKNESFLTLTAKIKKQWSMIIIIAKSKQVLMKLLCPNDQSLFETLQLTKKQKKKNKKIKYKKT